MRVLCLIPVLFLLGAGCGAEDAAPTEQLESLVTVIDHDGKETQISSSELFDPETGEPTVQKVLVVDRRAKKKTFVDAKELQSQNPSAPRYFPVTKEPSSES